MYEAKVPQRIGRLSELASNLWWSWHPQGPGLFRALDGPLWRSSGYNPIQQIREVSPEKLDKAASDPAFLALYDSVISAFDAYLSAGDTWYATTYPDRPDAAVAYFSAEFALHNSLPIYAGGLGVLAGDTCKEASDLGLPLVAVGFMYPQGYFHQHISAEGWQEEIYEALDFQRAPVSPCPWPEGCGPLVQVQLPGRPLHIWTWLVKLGRVSLYLLDTNVDQNSPEDRQLSAHLYIADAERRIQQEMVLGVAGVRALRALGIRPSVWHANEGHSAFMMLERAREEVKAGASFAEAVQRVRASTVFTTHTPVPAGHDVFPASLVERYFGDYDDSLGIDHRTLLGLGQQDSQARDTFNMTVLSLRMAGRRNGVSRLHGAVARRMWQGLWPALKAEEVPIGHITNGIHVPTWVSEEMGELYDRYLGNDWRQRQDDPALWNGVLEVPDEEIWSVRRQLKLKMMAAILERARERWASGEVVAHQVVSMGALLDPEALTIGFARRFVEYKRPALIFRDVDRLRRILADPSRPVQMVFAGKSHPTDLASKYLLHQVYNLSVEGRFEGRIALIEDYDVHMAHYLTQGVDVWLNNPRRLQEASGTSGMKAALNGVLHVSVRDGWWHEGHNGANGWAIGDDAPGPDEDRADAEALYALLENEIVPFYYDRGPDGIPRRWIGMAKEAVRSLVPAFSARRMLKEYAERAYWPSD